MKLIDVFKAVMDAENGSKLAVYQVGVSDISRGKKRGQPTTVKLFPIKTDEFNPNDALEGLAAWVVIGRIDKLQALEDAALPPPSQTAEGWQPMETAPKPIEGGDLERIVLGFAPDETGYSLPSREGYWNSTLKNWVSTLDPNWTQSPIPTHWMPLPAAPSSRQKEGIDASSLEARKDTK